MEGGTGFRPKLKNPVVSYLNRTIWSGGDGWGTQDFVSDTIVIKKCKSGPASESQ